MPEIDFVIAWVDGSDPDWQRRKAACLGERLSDDREHRYRDWDLLRYWFRGVEAFAPWVRKVWFVCDQEPPRWLNDAHPRLQIARHEDFIPEAYRPAFSANPIELNMHRIPGLAERFVFFNDDMFLLKPTSEGDFFKNGLPVDAALLNPVPTTDLRGRGRDAIVFTIPLNDVEVLNRDYDFRACVKAHPLKWLNLRYGKSLLRNLALMTWPRFVGFDEPHLPQPFLKASFEAAWQQDFDVLDATSRRSIRNDRDVNQWLIRQRQLAEGRFMPRSPKVGRVFDLDVDAAGAAEAIRGQSAKMICVNDGALEPERFEAARRQLQAAFEAILPKPCGFER